MKLVDILFVLTAATTANAILIPTNNNGSLQASGTSSQVSGPTDEPNPDTSNDWQSIVDELDLSIFSQDQQQQMDESSSGTSSQVSGSINEPIPQIPDQDWQEIMDIIHSNIPTQDQQQSIDVVDPSTSNQDQQQPMNEADSASTSSNQMTRLNKKYQKTFDRLRKRLELSKEIRNKKRQEYHKYKALGYRKWSALAMGKEIHGSKYNPEDEKQLKQEYVAARNRVASVRQELKKFTERHGLEFQEPNSDSD
ncbi:hypothetical protein O5D80_007208 [Batrachochytrium dendrobatidis]|nr:hypothetical protein O5D80_007208 [Batrachochytrium dendrobatidis]